MAGTPSAILFMCNFNTVRSPMAAALARHVLGRRAYVMSAGIRRGEPDPFAAAAMDELGLDIARHRSRLLEDLDDLNFDLVLTLAPEAHHRALELTRNHAIDVEYWPTPDPTATQGSREQMLDAYRAVRDGLARRIAARFGLPAPFSLRP